MTCPCPLTRNFVRARPLARPTDTEMIPDDSLKSLLYQQSNFTAWINGSESNFSLVRPVPELRLDLLTQLYPDSTTSRCNPFNSNTITDSSSPRHFALFILT